MVDLLIRVARRSVKLPANGWEGTESIRQNLIVVYHNTRSIFERRFEATDLLNIIFIVIIIILVINIIIIIIFIIRVLVLVMIIIIIIIIIVSVIVIAIVIVIIIVVIIIIIIIIILEMFNSHSILCNFMGLHVDIFLLRLHR